jgi:5-(carboxyamino)imidazole ribonucleotide synthase
MTAILPGATIGVLGSGQLGRMFAIAARRLGYRVRTFSPDYDTPTGQVADVEVTAAYDDRCGAPFAPRGQRGDLRVREHPGGGRGGGGRRVRPAGACSTAQHRIGEGVPRQTGFPYRPRRIARRSASTSSAWAIRRAEDRRVRLRRQGQSRIASPPTPRAWRLGRPAGDPRGLRGFRREISVVAAALDAPSPTGAHRTGTAPHSRRGGLRQVESARRWRPCGWHALLEALDMVASLRGSSFSPRWPSPRQRAGAAPAQFWPLTFDASVTSQFEQQLTVCGLPLGATELLAHARPTPG